jgi:Glycine zipper
MATDRSDRPNSTEPDRNPDPITGAPGSHPAGTGIGAASGAATGAAIGALGGPVGAAIGIIAGGIVGGLVGKGVGEKVDPTEDESYWRDEYRNRPYYSADHDYDRDLAPAYRYGGAVGMGLGSDYDRPVRTGPVSTTGTTAGANADTIGSTSSNLTSGNRSDSTAGGRNYDDYESDIREGWEKVKGKSTLSYDRAKDAIRDAFDRRAKSRRESAMQDDSTVR